MSKHILFISTLEVAPWGGSEEIWYELTKALLNDGHTVSLDRIEWPVVPAKVQELIGKGVQYFARPNPHIVHSKLNIKFRVRNKLSQLNSSQRLKQIAPDYIIISLAGTFDNLLLRYSNYLLSCNVPYILISQHANEHYYFATAERETYRRLFQKAKQVYFVSERNKIVAERALCSAITNTTLIYSPAVIDKQPDTPYPQTQVPKLACAARLEVTYKGQDILLQVLSAAKWKQRPWELAIYGEGDHKQYLQSLVQFYKLKDRVFFKGFAKNVKDIWLNNQLLIMPSHSEGTPISLLQAGFYSRAALVTDVGGNGEIVEDLVSGFIAEAPTMFCIDRALETAFAHKENWMAMGEKAKARVERLVQEKDYHCILDFLKNDYAAK